MSDELKPRWVISAEDMERGLIELATSGATDRDPLGRDEMARVFPGTSRVLSQIHVAKPAPDDEEAAAKSISTLLLEAKLKRHEQTTALRRRLAGWAMITASVLLAVSAMFFAAYMRSVGSAIDPKVMMTWLGTVMVEVLGIVAIIARSVFPVLKDDDPEP